ncbi:GLUG motif-containing protein, partial [Clostridium sp. D33t1_170424_F3]|uniref:GLUG motif-containing protein n=1 Tax=Clostridium sp. D33t1_170424_F3 TaxID=2787099 RepID=UPI0018ABF1FB
MRQKRSTKLLSLFLSLTLLLSTFTGTMAFAAKDTGASAFAGGAGTVEDPYEITTVAQLRAIRNDLEASYRLGKSLTLPEGNWEPIGKMDAEFKGTFDGANYTISGLTQDDRYADRLGLFGYMRDASVSNLLVEVDFISGHNLVGGIAGYAVGGAILNCGVVGMDEDSYISATNTNLGGLVGEAHRTVIDGCFTSIDVLGDVSCSPVGGLVGAYNGEKTNMEYGTEDAIKNCFTTGNVRSGSSSAGGLVGALNGASMFNCFATGNISTNGSSSQFVGGLVGSMKSDNVGSTGYKHAGTVENCYFAGAVQEGGAGAVAYLFGEGTGAGVNYYNDAIENGFNQVQKCEEPVDLTPKSIEEMQSEAFVEELNDASVDVSWIDWTYNENGFPALFGVGENFESAEPGPELESYSHYSEWKTDGNNDGPVWFYQKRVKADKSWTDFTNWNTSESAWAETTFGSSSDWGKIGQDIMVSLFGANSSYDGVAYAWKAPQAGRIRISFETEITATKPNEAPVQISKGTQSAVEEILRTYTVKNDSPTTTATADLTVAEVAAGDYIRIAQFGNVDNDVKNVRPVISYLADDDATYEQAILGQLCDQAEALLSGDYTAESLAALQDELDAARTVQENGFATAAEYLAAYDALQAAIDALVAISYTKLDQAPMAATVVADSEHTTSSSSGDGPARWAFDGKQDTWWHSHWTLNIQPNHWIAWGLSNDLSESYYVAKVEYQPRTSGGSPNGRFGQYVLEVNNDATSVADTPDSAWTQVANGTWANDAVLKTIVPETPVQANKIRLRSLTTYGDPANSFGSAQEINVYATDEPTPPSVNKDALQELYNIHKDKEQGGYTQSSWQAFVTALEAAGLVLANNDATQQQVDDAKKALEDAVLGLTTPSGETRAYIFHPYLLKNCMNLIVPVGETAVVKWEWVQEQNGYVPTINGSMLRNDLTFDAAAIAPVVAMPVSGDKQVVGGLQKVRAIPDPAEYTLSPTAETPAETDIQTNSKSPDVPFSVQYVDQNGETLGTVQRVAGLYDSEFYVGATLNDIPEYKDQGAKLSGKTYTTINVTRDADGNDIAIPSSVSFTVDVPEQTKEVSIQYTLNNEVVSTATETLYLGDPAKTITAVSPSDAYLLNPAVQTATAEYTLDGKIKINGKIVTGAPVITFTLKRVPPPKAYYDFVVNGEKAFTLGLEEGKTATVQWKKYQPPYIDGKPTPDPYLRLEIRLPSGKSFYPTYLTELDGTKYNGFKHNEIELKAAGFDVTGAYNLPDIVRSVPLDQTITPIALDLAPASGDAVLYPSGSPKALGITIGEVQPEVTVVKVTHPSEKIEKGTTEQFLATVEGTNVTQNVTWSIVGAHQNSKTTIDENGLLTVDENEPYDIFIVRATSVDDPTKYGDAHITMTPAGMPKGSGTEEDPYMITTAKELNAIRNLSSTYSPKYFKIVNDIDLSDYAETWTPIGTERSNRFGGIIDGNNKTIRGLKVDTGDAMYAGLFGFTEGTMIRNLTVEVVSVNGKTYVGGLIGYANETTLIGCGVKAANADSKVVGTGSEIGGLTGVALGTTLKNCYAEIPVQGIAKLGGLVGSYSGNSKTEITNCYATGDVTSTNTNVESHIHTGGLVGNAQKAKINNSFATGTVTATGKRIGGLTGTISGSSGGEKGWLQNSFASGAIHAGEGSTWVGGLTGTLEGGGTAIVNGYYNNAASSGCGLVSPSLSDTSTGKTAEELKSHAFALELNTNASSYSNWAKWGFDSTINNGHPVLCEVGVGEGVDEVTDQPVDKYVHYTVLLSNVGGLLQTSFEVDVKVGDSL